MSFIRTIASLSFFLFVNYFFRIAFIITTMTTTTTEVTAWVSAHRRLVNGCSHNIPIFERSCHGDVPLHEQQQQQTLREISVDLDALRHSIEWTKNQTATPISTRNVGTNRKYSSRSIEWNGIGWILIKSLCGKYNLLWHLYIYIFFYSQPSLFTTAPDSG
jgi:hypothetical protein